MVFYYSNLHKCIILHHLPSDSLSPSNVMFLSLIRAERYWSSSFILLPQVVAHPRWVGLMPWHGTLWGTGDTKASPDLRGSANLENLSQPEGLSPAFILLVHKTFQTSPSPSSLPQLRQVPESPGPYPTPLSNLWISLSLLRFPILISINKGIKILHKVCFPLVSHTIRCWASWEVSVSSGFVARLTRSHPGSVGR